MEMNVRRIFSLLLVKAKYIILVAIITAVAFFACSRFLLTDQYKSTSKFLVVMEVDSNRTKTSEASFVKEAIHSYLEIFNTTKFFNEVANTYNQATESSLTADQIKAMTKMEASSNQDAPSFTISVTSSSPEVCYDLVSAVSVCAIEKSRMYEALNAIEMIDDPIMPISPFAPNTTKNTLTGFLIGAVLMCAFYVFKDTLDIKIKHLEDVTKLYDISILGVIPDTASNAKKSSKQVMRGYMGKENQ